MKHGPSMWCDQTECFRTRVRFPPPPLIFLKICECFRGPVQRPVQSAPASESRRASILASFRSTCPTGALAALHLDDRDLSAELRPAERRVHIHDVLRPAVRAEAQHVLVGAVLARERDAGAAQVVHAAMAQADGVAVDAQRSPAASP